MLVKNFDLITFIWSGQRGSNPRPSRWQRDALPLSYARIIVLWQYFLNDLAELEREIELSILKKYLYEDNYSQKLISRQKEISNHLNKFCTSRVGKGNG